MGDAAVAAFTGAEILKRRGEVPRELIDGACLLCSEEKPHKCHRRLVAEYLRERWEGVEIVHLG